MPGLFNLSHISDLFCHYGKHYPNWENVLITGAASGVGFAMANLCRNKDMHLALLYIDQSNLVKAKNVFSEINDLTTEAYTIDVADSTSGKRLLGKLRAFPRRRSGRVECRERIQGPKPGRRVIEAVVGRRLLEEGRHFQFEGSS